MPANCTQSRQAKHHVTELAKVDNENIFEFRMLLIQAAILQHSEIGARHFRGFFDA